MPAKLTVPSGGMFPSMENKHLGFGLLLYCCPLLPFAFTEQREVTVQGLPLCDFCSENILEDCQDYPWIMPIMLKVLYTNISTLEQFSWSLGESKEHSGNSYFPWKPEALELPSSAFQIPHLTGKTGTAPQCFQGVWIQKAGNIW